MGEGTLKSIRYATSMFNFVSKCIKIMILCYIVLMIDIQSFEFIVVHCCWDIIYLDISLEDLKTR